MIVLYGGNGMSEAPYIFFTLWAVRRLLRWVRTDQVNDLVVAGIALGLDYLTRYEAVAAAARSHRRGDRSGQGPAGARPGAGGSA